MGCPDFSGEWDMDLQRSDWLGPVLRELGLNFLVSCIICRLAVHQSILQDADSLTIDVKTSLGSQTLRLPFDGSVARVVGMQGETSCVTCWVGQQLETKQCVSLDAKNPEEDSMCFVTARSLQDGGNVLVEDCSVRCGKTVLASARRYLVRRAKAS